MATATQADPLRRGYGPLWWLAAFAVWTLLAAMSITQSALFLAYRGQPIAWGPLVGVRLVDWYTCALFLPGLVWLARRYPLERAHWRAHGLIQLAATTVFVIGKYALLLPIERHFAPALGATLTGLLAANALTELMIFWAVIGVLHAIEFYRRFQEREHAALQLEAALADARFETLTSQLRPHFLFNTLNGVIALMRRDIDAAERMVTELADLLSASLRALPSQEIALSEELALLERYISIMQVRFGSRLTIERAIAPGVSAALLPAFLFQPLVENALEHGIARRPGPGRVVISAERVGDALRLSVSDNGPGVTSSALPETAAGIAHGVGLENTRQRLAHLYGRAQRLTLASVAGDGARTVVELPYHETRAG